MQKLYNLLVKDLTTHLYHTLQTEILNQHLGTSPNFARSASKFRASGMSANSAQPAREAPKFDVERIVGGGIGGDHHKSTKAWSNDLKETNPAIEAMLDSPKNNPAGMGGGGGNTSLATSVARKIIVDVECLCRLNKLNEAIESLKVDQYTELQAIVRRSTRAYLEVKENMLPAVPSAFAHPGITVTGPGGAAGATGAESENGTDVLLLSGLFTALVNQFSLSADVYAIMSRAVQKSVERNSSTDLRMDKNEIWIKVQCVVQLMLTGYLDFSNETSIHQPTSAQYSEPTSDINSYFVRRKGVRPKKVSLFKFESSSTGLSLNDFYKEKRKEQEVHLFYNSNRLTF